MSDTPLLKELLRQILEGISRIERRFEPIDSADDFSKDNDGVDRLDGIAMMLIGIGECLKRFEKSGGKSLLEQHDNIDWKGAKGIRDFLSHQYFDIDTEIVFAICQNHIQDLKTAILAIQNQIE